MNTQELFESLGRLEKELGNIKSARILAEETITSYRDTQQEISRLLAGLSEADARLATIGQAFETQNLTLSDRLREGVENIDGRLNTIGKDFQAKCDESGSGFSDRIKAAINDLKMETGAIMNEFAAENARFKDNVDILDAVYQGLENMREEIRGLDGKLAEYREKLDALQKDAGEKTQKTRIYIAENHHIIMDRLDALQQNLDEKTQNMLSLLSTANGTQLEKLVTAQQYLEGMTAKFGEFREKIEEIQRNATEKAQNILSSLSTGNEMNIEKLGGIQQTLEARFKNIEDQNRRHRDNLLEKINTLKVSIEEKIQKTIAYIAEINLNSSNRVKGFQKSTEDRLQDIETLLEEDRKKREENQTAMLKSEKRIQAWLIILIVMTGLLLIYPFFEKYMRV